MEANRCFGCMEETHSFPCPRCGYDPQRQKGPDYVICPDTILNGKYLVGKMLGQGGFGITYVGWDLALERKVAIKEYFPSGQVGRYPGKVALQWYSNTQSDAARQSGMEMFLKEARKMSRVDGVGQVVHVRDLFQENNTAYIVMDYVEGETLKSRLTNNGPLSWKEAKDVFLPAIDAMEKVHKAGLIHRDLSPDNLMLTPEGDVKILDLGAAKDLNVNTGISSMQVAKCGFSPMEQYTQRGGSGPWSDVYAMAATMYYALTGVLPQSAVDRLNEDNLHWDLPQLQDLPENVICALQNAMVLRIKGRTQTMAEFAAQLKAVIEPKPIPEPEPESAKAAPKRRSRNAMSLMIAAGTLVIVIAAVAISSMWGKNNLSLSSNKGEEKGTSIAENSEVAKEATELKENYTFRFGENKTGKTITRFEGKLPAEIVFPWESDGSPVTRIGANAFKDCTDVSSIVIPDSVTRIESNAFSGCTSLTRVSIPDGVEEIDSSAFEGTPWLNNQTDEFVICGDGVLLKYNGTKSDVVIPSGTKKIVAGVFSGCTSLSSISIPDSVTVIGDSAFYGCTSLLSVTIPDSVTFVGSKAWYGCSSLTSVTISDNISTIEEKTFFGCTKLSSVTIPETVSWIREGAFSGCTRLTVVTISEMCLCKENTFPTTCKIKYY